MKLNPNRVISTAVLALLLGITIPAFAKQDHEKKSGGREKAQQAQHQAQPQHLQQAQPQYTQPARPQRTQQAQPLVVQNRDIYGSHYGRISDDHYLQFWSWSLVPHDPSPDVPGISASGMAAIGLGSIKDGH